MQLNIPRYFLGLLALAVSSIALYGQAPLPSPLQLPSSGPGAPRALYVLNPKDSMMIRALNVEEINEKTFSIDDEGYLNLPVAGRLRAAGRTVEQLETAITDRLKAFIRAPQVVITIIEGPKAAVQEVANPLFLSGAFKAPGMYAMSTTRQERLVDLLIRTGGLQPNGNHRVKLVRRADQGALPLPGAAPEQGGQVTAAEIALTPSLETVNPKENVVLKPYDVLIANKVESVYITGEVVRSGAFPLEEKESLSAAQVLAMAGGPAPNAAVQRAWVLRPIMDTGRRAEIPLDLKAILQGHANDFPLLPNDVLYVPRKSGMLNGTGRMLLVVVPALITTAIYVGLR